MVHLLLIFVVDVFLPYVTYLEMKLKIIDIVYNREWICLYTK